MRRRAFITLLGGAAAWPLAAQGEQPPLQLRLERRAQVSGQRAGKLAFVSMIGLLSSRPPFGRIEPATEFGPRAARAPRCGITDGPSAHDSPIAPQ
ncbi:MAG: hypothetical protein AUI16_24395 [Alphaproteobacteria bacterium 13_2_20CM_2_64_7]|jgi:hypothetical protein|nr:MAG: hypothetical protein AUI16_24395 [Alphaproteobacteria bacterium 13_2_20CM_2_64_7]